MAGHVPTPVYFLDNSFKSVLVPSKMTAGELTNDIARKMSFPESHIYWFGLYESLTGTTLDRPVNKDEDVASLVAAWRGDGVNKLVFLIRLFFSPLLSSPDLTLLYYRYTQAVHSVISGQYQVSEELAIKLACLQIQAKFGGKVNSSRDFLGGRLVEFIPQRILSSRTDDWHAVLSRRREEDQQVRNMLEDEARHAYLKLVEELPIYGSTIYRVIEETVSFSRDILLAVNSLGIQLYEVDAQQPYKLYELQTLLQWGYDPGISFHIEVRHPEGGMQTVTFGTRVGQYASETLTSYAYGYIYAEKLMGLTAENLTALEASQR